MICTNCFDTDFVTVNKSYTINDNGVEKVFDDVEREECPSCGYCIFTQSQAISLDKKRVELDFGNKTLLTPYQLKLLRNVLNITLDQISEILHIGKNSYGRWERGESEITPSMNLLIHSLIDRVPVAKVNLIEAEMSQKILAAKRKILSREKNISLGKYIKDCIEETGILSFIICEYVDMQEECLRNIENNKIDITSVAPVLVYKLAKFFKATYDELENMVRKSLDVYRIGGDVSFIHARIVDNTKSFTKDEENSIGDILEAVGACFNDEFPSSNNIDEKFFSEIKKYYDTETKGDLYGS